MKRRAILSVSDKSGLAALAAGLVELGFELIASGGTARALSAAEVPVTSVEQVTGFPEFLGGRVKTLHPAIHGGILARRTPERLAELAAHGLAPIELVVCNLYPFVAAATRPGATEAEVVEEIDIGGMALLRAAAKNFESVAAVCDPADYAWILQAIRGSGLMIDDRRRLALKAFGHAAAYDAAIAGWLATKVEGEQPLPTLLALAAERAQLLRYGENPHQQAALYRSLPGTFGWSGLELAFEQLQGKELSYNNIVDLEAAWAVPQEHAEPTVAIIKHTNPSGLASAHTLAEAYRLALECDPVSAFGSIIACNRQADQALMEAIGPLFVEVLAAPSYTPDALAWLAGHKKNCRVMIGPTIDPRQDRPDLMFRSVTGGMLVQTVDRAGTDLTSWRTVSERQPTADELRSLEFAWFAVKHVKSNAIVLVRGTATVGVGAGQMNRVESVHLAARRAGDRARGAVLGSDAFFPFADGIEAAADAGVTAVIQPGGSQRDEEAIAAANRRGMAMVFTGERHFRH